MSYIFDKLFSSIWRLALLPCCLLLLSACHHIPLYDGTSGVYLVLNIVPDSQTKEKIENGKGTLPTSVKVNFYSPETHELVAEDFLTARGGFINVPVGTYNILIYSLGNELTQLKGMELQNSGMAFTSLVGATLNMSKAGSDSGDGTDPSAHVQFPIVYQPDYLYTASIGELFVPERASLNETIRLEVDLKPIVQTWTFIAENIDGEENIQSAFCYVTGQIKERYMWDARYTVDICALPFEVSYVQDSRSICGDFQTFGKHPLALSNVFLNVQVVNSTGALYQWIFNVTEQFNNPDNVQHLLIVSDKIVVPSSEDGGFTPSVNDWDADITYVPL